MAGTQVCNAATVVGSLLRSRFKIVTLPIRNADSSDLVILNAAFQTRWRPIYYVDTLVAAARLEPGL